MAGEHVDQMHLDIASSVQVRAPQCATPATGVGCAARLSVERRLGSLSSPLTLCNILSSLHSTCRLQVSPRKMAVMNSKSERFTSPLTYSGFDARNTSPLVAPYTADLGPGFYKVGCLYPAQPRDCNRPTGRTACQAHERARVVP